MAKVKKEQKKHASKLKQAPEKDHGHFLPQVFSNLMLTNPFNPWAFVGKNLRLMNSAEASIVAPKEAKPPAVKAAKTVKTVKAAKTVKPAKAKKAKKAPAVKTVKTVKAAKPAKAKKIVKAVKKAKKPVKTDKAAKTGRKAGKR